MIKRAKPLLITASLLNSWIYLFDNQLSDEKIAFDDFLKVLNREPTEQTEAMKLGNEFEQECYDGKVSGISNLIESGAFQVSASKIEIINGLTFVLYGRLDVLKNGIIYDIKRVSRYNDVQKYYTSAQHPMYLELIPQAKEFIYLISDGELIYQEKYTRKDFIKPIQGIITDFVNWLKRNDLFEKYVEKWESK